MERHLNGSEKCCDRTLAKASDDRSVGGPRPTILGIPGLNKDRWGLENPPLYISYLSSSPHGQSGRHLPLGIASISLQPGPRPAFLAISVLFFSCRGLWGKPATGGRESLRMMSAPLPFSQGKGWNSQET